MRGIAHTEKPKHCLPVLSTGKIIWESRNKGNMLEISVASLEEVDPRASKSMGNFVKYISIKPLKQEEWEDMRSDTGTANLHLSTPCAGSTPLPWNFQALVPVTQFWEGTRTVPWHWSLRTGAAAQSLSKLGQFLADCLYCCTVAGRVSGGVPAFGSHPQGALESWSWSIWMKREVKTLASSIYQLYPVNAFPSHVERFTLSISRVFFLLLSVLRFSLSCYPRLEFKIWRIYDGTWPE